MVRSTQVVRVSDALPLAQSVDDDQTGVDLTRYKQQAKTIFRKLTPMSETRCTIESGPMALQYVARARTAHSRSYLVQPPPGDPRSVVYLTITDKSYPRKLAFSYLDELAKEFALSYGHQVQQRNLRPYAFVGFGRWCDAHARHLHAAYQAPLRGLAHRRKRHALEPRPAQRGPAGRAKDYDQEHGGFAMAWR